MQSSHHHDIALLLNKLLPFGIGLSISMCKINPKNWSKFKALVECGLLTLWEMCIVWVQCIGEDFNFLNHNTTGDKPDGWDIQQTWRKWEIHRNFLPKSSRTDTSQDQSDDKINYFITGTRLQRPETWSNG